MLAMTGCNLLPFKIRVSNPPADSTTQVAASSDWMTNGFTAIPTDGSGHWENPPTEVYEAILHYYADPGRPIALSKTSSGGTWIGKQEIFTGPNFYAMKR